MILQIGGNYIVWFFAIVLFGLLFVLGYKLDKRAKSASTKPSEIQTTSTNASRKAIPADLFSGLAWVAIISSLLLAGFVVITVSSLAGRGISPFDLASFYLPQIIIIIVGIISGITWYYIGEMAKQHNELIKLLKPKE